MIGIKRQIGPLNVIFHPYAKLLYSFIQPFFMNYFLQDLQDKVHQEFNPRVEILGSGDILRDAVCAVCRLLTDILSLILQAWKSE